MKFLLGVFQLGYMIMMGVMDLGGAKSGPCSKIGLKEIMENKFYNVKTFDHPSRSVITDFCQSSWMDQGTCCDGKDALQFTINWLSSVK